MRLGGGRGAPGTHTVGDSRSSHSAKTGSEGSGDFTPDTCGLIGPPWRPRNEQPPRSQPTGTPSPEPATLATRDSRSPGLRTAVPSSRPARGARHPGREVTAPPASSSAGPISECPLEDGSPGPRPERRRRCRPPGSPSLRPRLKAAPSGRGGHGCSHAAGERAGGRAGRRRARRPFARQLPASRPRGPPSPAARGESTGRGRG